MGLTNDPRIIEGTEYLTFLGVELSKHPWRPRLPIKATLTPNRDHAVWCPRYDGLPHECACRLSPMGRLRRRHNRREVRMAKRSDKIEVYRREDGLFDWRRKSGYNGQVVSTSGNQGYKRFGNCYRGAVKNNPDVPLDRIVGIGV